jgi:hypothetical protein
MLHRAMSAEAAPFESRLPAPDSREAALYARLAELGIAWITHAHAPVFTVDEARALRGALPGTHTRTSSWKTGGECFGLWSRAKTFVST